MTIPDNDMNPAALVAEAQGAFWARLVEFRPDVTTGDMDPAEALAFDEACKRAVHAWLAVNAPCSCHSEPVPGAPFPWNDRAEVQRCYGCDLYSSDGAAAAAVCTVLNERAGRDGVPCGHYEAMSAECDDGDVVMLLYRDGMALTHEEAINLSASLRPLPHDAGRKP